MCLHLQPSKHSYALSQWNENLNVHKTTCMWIFNRSISGEISWLPQVIKHHHDGSYSIPNAEFSSTWHCMAEMKLSILRSSSPWAEFTQVRMKDSFHESYKKILALTWVMPVKIFLKNRRRIRPKKKTFGETKWQLFLENNILNILAN